MGLGWSLGLMATGLPLAVLGALVYRARQRLAAVMISGAGLLLVGAVGLLITLW
jgi:hypothetical protein